MLFGVRAGALQPRAVPISRIGGETVSESADETGFVALHEPSQSLGALNGVALDPPGHAS
jgi:hypothetical protein